MEEANGSCLIKIVLLGGPGVGKSCLMQSYTTGASCEPGAKYLATRGVEFCSGFSEPFGEKINFQIWDTAGDPRYRAPTQRYCQNAAACACLFNRTDRASLEICSHMLEEVREACGPKLPVVMVGTKSDLVGTGSVLSEVSNNEARAVARAAGIEYHEVSTANDPDSVQRVFSQLIALALRAKMIEGSQDDAFPEESMMCQQQQSEPLNSKSESDDDTPPEEDWSPDSMMQFVEQLATDKTVVEAERDLLKCQLRGIYGQLPDEVTQLSDGAPSSTPQQPYSPYRVDTPTEQVLVAASAESLCEWCGWGSACSVLVCERCGNPKFQHDVDVSKKLKSPRSSEAPTKALRDSGTRRVCGFSGCGFGG